MIVNIRITQNKKNHNIKFNENVIFLHSVFRITSIRSGRLNGRLQGLCGMNHIQMPMFPLKPFRKHVFFFNIIMQIFPRKKPPNRKTAGGRMNFILFEVFVFDLLKRVELLCNMLSSLRRKVLFPFC